MRWDANTQLSLVAIAIAAMALVISLFAAFPGLKNVFSVLRDGVLWLAMLLILSGAGFVVYQRLQHQPSISQRPTMDGLPTRDPAPRPLIPEPRHP